MFLLVVCAFVVAGRVVAAAPPPGAAGADDMELLRIRTVSVLLPSASTIAKASQAARAAQDSMAANGSWPDINYADTGHGAHDHWQPSAHMERLNAMIPPLVACELAANKMCNDTRLGEAADRALHFWLQRNPCSENWYFNQIDAPGQLADALLLLQHGGRLSNSTLQAADIDLRRGADWWRGWSGYNLVALAKLQIYRGLLWSNEALVQQGFAAVWAQLAVMPWPPPRPSNTAAETCNSSAVAQYKCIPKSCQTGGGSYLGDGIQRDGSFHQHGAQLLDGAYGAGLTSAILDFLPLGHDTKWRVEPGQLQAFALLIQGQQRMTLSGRLWDWQVCGRGCIAEPGLPRNGISSAKLSYAASLFSAFPDLQAQVARFARSQNGTSTRATAGSLTGTFSYFRSDYLLHRRHGWSASWKGRSNRTIPARCVNDDSKLSADTGEGATFVYRDAEEGSAHVGIWPLINWQQFPGTTVQQGALQGCAWQYQYNFQPSFVGSVVSSDGAFGAAAQQLAQNQGMTAQRSWLFLDHGVASMVTNVSSSANASQSPVYTTLCNQNKHGEIYIGLDAAGNGVSPAVLPLGQKCEHGGTTPFRGDAIRFVWHNFTTYYISGGGGKLHIDCSFLTGDYYKVSTQHRNASNSLFRLSYEHRLESETNYDTFGYIVLPNTPLPSITDQSAVTMTLGSNSSDATHVITNYTAGIASIVFWQPNVRAFVQIGANGLNLSASLPCLVLLRVTEGAGDGTPSLLSVSASSPDQPGRKLTLELGATLLQVRGAGCSSAPGGSAIEFQLPDGDRSGNSTTCTATAALLLESHDGVGNLPSQS